MAHLGALLFCFFLNTRNNRISSSIKWNLQKIDLKYLINIVDLHRRKFCDGRNILVFLISFVNLQQVKDSFNKMCIMFSYTLSYCSKCSIIRRNNVSDVRKCYFENQISFQV